MQSGCVKDLIAESCFMDNKPKITFCTGVGTVTGANFLLETSLGTKILIDCGLVQGERVAESVNHEDFIYDPASISALFVTHAHLDHVGRIPKLVKDGYSGPIYSTPQTRDLAELILNDAVAILANEARNEGEEPLYDSEDVSRVFPLWRNIDYHEEFRLNDEVSVLLKDAGHILGSSMVQISLKSGERILFTGDLGNSPAPLLRDTENVGEVDYIIMESVYGDRNHEARAERLNMLERVIKETIVRGGTLVIPAFSLDRTQVLLYELNNLVEQARIPAVPVFLDSPMAIKATAIYKSNSDLFNANVQTQIKNGDDVFSFPKLQFTISQNDSVDIDSIKGAKIILAGSGMSIGGRVIGHEKKYLPDAKNTILFVGYQTAGSLGRQLSDGAKKVRIGGMDVKVKAQIETLFGYSAHKDGDNLVKFISTSGKDLKGVFVAMGEPGASMHLSQRLNDELGVKAIVPEKGKSYDLGQ